MKYIDFSPFGVEAVEINFKCNNCSSVVDCGRISVPSPYFGAEKTIDSENEVDELIHCSNCEEEYIVTVAANISGGYISITELGSDADVNVTDIDEEPPEEFESIIDNTDYFSTFKNEVTNIRALLAMVSSISTPLQPSFLRMLFIAGITSLETFLSDAFISSIFNESNPKIRKFVEMYKPFTEQKISFSEIYKYETKIEVMVKKELIDIIYHNIAKVSNLYKHILDVNFPDYTDIARSITKRHDLVHRNGKTKDGTAIILEAKDINDLLEYIDRFVININEQLNPLPF